MDVAVTGVDAAVALLDTLAGRLGDPEPAWAEIHAAFLAMEAKRFDDEGPGWSPLASSTVAEKARHGWSDRILEATGALRSSLTDDTAAGSVFAPSPLSVTMGTDYRSPRQTGRWADVALGSFHQGGTGRMPARPVIDPGPEDLAGWAAILVRYLTA